MPIVTHPCREAGSTPGRWRRLTAACLPVVAGLLVLACGGGSTTGSIGTGGDSFSITVRYIDSTPPSAAVQAAFTRAIAKWKSVIIDSVGSRALPNLPAGSCDSAQPALSETVKDLLIMVHIRQIPDSTAGQAILGEASPCIVRVPSFIPVFGVMSLNSGTLTFLANNGLLDAVIEHEFAHLLGFGTVWGLDALVRDTLTGTPWFAGTRATAAFHTAAPNFTGNAVPVEASGSSGTSLSHWRESVMGSELMTGFLNLGANPLSNVTIQAMADLGYTVNAAAAEPWSTTSASVNASVSAAWRTPTASGSSLTHTLVRRPTFMVDEAGRLRRLPASVAGLPLH